MTTYKIVLNNKVIETVELEGIAIIKYDTAKMIGDAQLLKIVDVEDPVFKGVFKYDDELGCFQFVTSNTRPCSIDNRLKLNCEYVKKYNGYNPQKNALRIELIPYQDKCSWDLKSDRIGGHIDDYNYCIK
jgi:hypothetical protein